MRQSSVEGRRTPATASRGSREAAPDPRLRRRVVIDAVTPEIDGGRFPIKRTVGERVLVTAALFADGHDVVAAVLCDRPGEHAGDIGWRETTMAVVAPGTDEWQAQFEVGQLGWHEYRVVAWVDPFLTWRRALQIKAAAGQDVSLELLEGSLLIREAAERVRLKADATTATAERVRRTDATTATPERVPLKTDATTPTAERIRLKADATTATPERVPLQADASTGTAEDLLESAEALTDDRLPVDERVAIAGDARLGEVMLRHADRSRATESAIRRVWVDRERARFSAWYEMFPRSAGPDPRRSGTFSEAAAELPRIADLGFDVLYLPPIHPIGRRYRKGRNNALVAAPDDPGSPWAIGSPDGGHADIDPALGTPESFEAFRAEAERLGLEIALDLAWQTSPDHPWVREHPEWFRHRPDGTIKYAENPPKQYQDIYPFDFDSDDWQELWLALADVTRAWIERGVRIFRVDNPHTKTFGFWEWFIDRIHEDYPDVIFLSEAFTRPRPMRYLAKAGFTQSYTYFTWRNAKPELVEYLTELMSTEVAEYLRPNLFANTPDILHEYLQQGGRPAFEARLLLAATLGASYGIYSGFELCENQPVRPGSEEYADSEKYQFRKRDWRQANNISELVCRINEIRRRHRALQFDRTLRFHATDNNRIIAYSKAEPDGSRRLLIIVNLDPHHMQHGFVETPFDADQFTVRDLLDDVEYAWHRGWNYVRFDPGIRQGHILEWQSTRHT